MADFAGAIAEGYAVEGPSIDLGRGVLDGEVVSKAVVRVPLSMMNRHGLVAGATGTGKTKTVQGIAEQLSAAGVSVFVADVKGDLSGLAAPGGSDGPGPKRMADLGLSYEPSAFPVEFLSLGGIGPGVPVRATVSDFGPLLRSLVGVEDGGGNEFFGEPQLDIADLLRTAPDGRGIVTCLELAAVQDKPRLFSTALMWILAELFEELPEVGDLEKPKLVFFFDEAHLLFSGATKAFVESVVQTVRMIRSKGVGVFFCTQVPKDVDKDVLAQLGNRIQHALRAFTPEDAKALKAAVSTYPTSDFYDLEKLLPSLGIGEAAVTILSESGVPTPVVQTRMRAPASRMAPADDVEGLATASPLYATYGTRIDSESARERLAARLEAPTPKPQAEHKAAAKASKAGGDALTDFLSSRQGKSLQNEIVRGVFGMLRKKL